LQSVVERSAPSTLQTANQLARTYGVGKEWRDILREDANANWDHTQVADGLEELLSSKGQRLTPVERTALEGSHSRDEILAQANTVADREASGPNRLNSPYRVKDVLDQNAGSMSADTGNALERVMERYGKRRGNVEGNIWNDYTKAVPAPWRPAVQNAQREIASYMSSAEAHPELRAQYLRLAEETKSTLAQLVESGFHPEHLIGGKPASEAGLAGALRGRSLTEPTLRGTHEATTGLRPQSLHDYVNLERDQAQRYIEGMRNRAIDEQLGHRADEIIGPELAQWAAEHNGETMPSDAIAERLKEAGHSPINPQEALGPQSRVLPRQVYRQAFPQQLNIPGLRQLGRTNRAFKTWVLPLSPRWHVGNVLGNAIQAGFHAGVGPLELVQRARQLAKASGGWGELFRNEGLVRGLPAEIAQGGFNQAEFDAMRQEAGAAAEQGGNRFGQGLHRFTNASYRLNNTIDNITRSSVYLARKMAGETSDQAMQSTLRSMGDYLNMSPVERQVFRQVFPFYSWLRHSIGATLRLPIQSPARAAFLLHLSDMYNDPNEKPGLLAMMGSRIPVFGKLLNLGGVSPFGDVSPFAFSADPANWGQFLAPEIKTAATVGLGVDPGNRFKALSRPGGTAGKSMFGTNQPTSPLERLFTDPLHGLGEIGWQALQQGPSQLRSIRDLALGSAPRYSGTGYTNPKGTPNASKRSIAQILRILNLPTPDQMPTGGAP
jgi:hypothetical protein